ncbi:MAG: large conductance mechanosensitive channel [Crocinitomix sp.]|jgi:large conductance mechanosensitive channel
MLKEFKKFILTGNVLDLAIAVILASAIGLVVKGFVDNIMMPIVGHFTGGVDFADMKYVLTEGVAQVLAEDGSEVVALVKENAISYGVWINALINLIIVGFVLFMIVKAANKSKKKQEAAPPAAPPAPTKEEVLLGEIRDLLKK